MDIPVRVLLHMVNIGALTGLASSLGAAATAQAGLAAATKPVTIGLTAMGAAIWAVAAAAALMGAALVTAGAMIAISIAGLIYDSIKMAMSFETAFANVRKAAEGTPAQLAMVRQGLLDLSLTIPVSPNQLASIAALGAQLGIAQGDLVSFTRTIAVLTTAVDGMTMEEATNHVAKFAAVMGNTKNWELISNVLVDLGNKGNSTEEKIIRMATRIGAAGHEIGLSVPTVLAFSAALANVGVEVFRGGTAAQRVLLAMRDAAQSGGQTLTSLAAVAGVAADKFQLMIRNSPDEAVRRLAIGMTTAKERGVDLTGALAQADVKAQLAKMTFLQLAGSGDLVKKAFDDAALAAKNNNAATEEARKKWETAANQLKLLENAITVISINVGTAFLPALGAIAEMLLPVLMLTAELTTGSTDLSKVIVDLAKTLTGMLLVALAYVLQSVAAVIKIAADMAFAFDKVKIAGMVLGAELFTLFSKVRMFFGQTAEAAKNWGIAEEFRKKAQQMAKDAVEQRGALGKLANGLVEIGIKSLQAASGQKGLAAGMKATSAGTKTLGGDLVDTTKKTGGLATGTGALTKEQEKAAKAAEKLAASIGTKGLAGEIAKMEKAITDVLKGGGKLTAEGIEKVAKLAAEGFAAGLRIPPNMQAVLAAKLAEDAQAALDKAKAILKARIEKQGGLFDFEDIRRAAMVVRTAQTGVRAEGVGTQGLWSVDPETLNGLRDLSEEARKAQEAYIRYLDEMSEGFDRLASMLGSVDELMDIFGVSSTSALRQIATGFAEVAASAATFLKGMASGNPAEMLAGVVGAIGAIKGMVTSGSGATRAAGGALAGFLVAGIPGAIAGAIIFGLRAPSWQRVAREAGEVLGENISEEMAKEIEKRAADMNITIRASALLSLPDIMGESTRGPLEFGQQIADLMTQIGNGVVPAREGMEALAGATEMVFAELERLGPAGSAVIGEFLDAAAAAGVMTDQMEQLARAAGGTFAEGMKKMFAAINNGLDVSAENVGKLGELTAFTYVRLRDLGFSMVEAMTMLGPAIDEAIKAIESTGATVGPMLAQLIDFRTRVLENQDLVNYVEGLNQVGDALLRLGMAMDPAAAQNFGDLTTQAFNDLIAAGFTAEQAVSMLGGSMRTLNILAEEGVIILTAEQEAMLAVARANGELDPTVEEQMRDLLSDIRDVLRDVARAFGVVTSETNGARSAAERWAAALRNVPAGVYVKIGYTGTGNEPPPTNPPLPPPPGEGEGFQHGGIVIAPVSGRQVTVHGTEAITPLEQVYGRMADIVASKLANAAVSASNMAPILISAPIYVMGRKVDEVLIERSRAGHVVISRESIDG